MTQRKSVNSEPQCSESKLDYVNVDRQKDCHDSVGKVHRSIERSTLAAKLPRGAIASCLGSVHLVANSGATLHSLLS
eukprot:5428914-Amphidinium_carterae.3